MILLNPRNFLIFASLMNIVVGWEYILDTSADLNQSIFTTLDCLYYANQDFDCNGTPVIPVDQFRNTSGFWFTCASIRKECFRYSRRPMSIVALEIIIEAYHHGVNTEIIITANTDIGDIGGVFRGTDSWQTHIIDSSVFPNIESVNYIRIGIDLTQPGFVVFDKIRIQFVDFTPPTIINTEPTTTPTATITTTPTVPTTTPIPSTTFNPCNNEKTNGEIQSEGLNNFLYWAFINYPRWLIDHGLDPTPPVIPPATIIINSTFLRLHGTFQHTSVWGISRDLHVMSSESDFIVPQLSFSLHISNLTLYGIYEAEGSVISTFPLSGQGVWALTNFSMDFSFHIEGFAIEDGFINLNKFDTRLITLNPNTQNVSFSIPELVKPEDADGLGQEVIIVLKQVIPEQLHSQDKHPVTIAILEYLNTIFSETPLSEIIATTRPPPCPGYTL